MYTPFFSLYHVFLLSWHCSVCVPVGDALCLLPGVQDWHCSSFCRVFQEELPAQGLSVPPEKSSKPINLDKCFEDYVRARSFQNWKFWIVSLVVSHAPATVWHGPASSNGIIQGVDYVMVAPELFDCQKLQRAWLPDPSRDYRLRTMKKPIIS